MDLYEFKAFLVYLTSSRLAKASIKMRPYLNSQFLKPTDTFKLSFTNEETKPSSKSLCLLHCTDKKSVHTTLVLIPTIV